MRHLRRLPLKVFVATITVYFYDNHNVAANPIALSPFFKLAIDHNHHQLRINLTITIPLTDTWSSNRHWKVIVDVTNQYLS